VFGVKWGQVFGSCNPKTWPHFDPMIVQSEDLTPLRSAKCEEVRMWSPWTRCWSTTR